MNQAKLVSIVPGLILILLLGCDTRIKTGEGFIDIQGGKIWYKVTGEGDNVPLLMLHGGPGVPGYYLNPLLKDLSLDRPVIIFDQLGCGRSNRITDTTLMTVDNYVEQVRALLDALNIGNVYLYGHSWGTMLGVDYYLKYGDEVKGIILSSPCLNANIWAGDADTLISMLPDSVQVVLRNNISGVPQDPATLGSAVEVFFNNYYWRKHPPSADIDSSLAQMGREVYEHMWGAAEFFSTGILKDYDRTEDLSRINVPTLYITGEFDVARPSTVRYYQRLTPDSRISITPNAGHMTMHDNADEDIKAISDFLSELDDLR